MNDAPTEADAIAALAAVPHSVNIGRRNENPDAGGAFVHSVPPGWERETIDIERYEDAPYAPRGIVQVHNSEGFVLAFNRRRTLADALADDTETLGVGNNGPHAVYADEDAMALVAILNDHYEDYAGWRDDRIALALRRRPEWEEWKAKDGQMMKQEEFAVFIEDHLAEIVRPEAAVMLDIAQTFQAEIEGGFKQATRLQSGAVQFRYEENIGAKAGTGGTMDIPEELGLEVVPFFGGPKYGLSARFRFTLRAGDLKLGYKLNRPGDVERAAFTNIVGAVATELGIKTIAGIAPYAVEPRG